MLKTEEDSRFRIRWSRATVSCCGDDGGPAEQVENEVTSPYNEL